MKMKGWIFAMAVALFAFTACDDDNDSDNQGASNNLEETDRMFVEKAAQANLTEVHFGTLAATKATDTLVKAYGQRMRTEHTTAQNELENIVNNFRNVSLPQQMDSAHQLMYDQLAQMAGHSFDSMYMTSQVTDHQMTLDLFETEIAGGQNQSVKAYANKYEPHIQRHLELADSVTSVIMSDNGTDGTDGTGGN